MKIPKEFEEALRGVELTNAETRFLFWLAGWEDLTIQNMRHVLEKTRAAGKTAQEPSAEPLTLEQLRKMDGQPVWIVESPDWGHWELSEDAEDYILDRDTDLYGLTYHDPDGKAGLHKLGWLAYAYPPAHIDREAWTAEWVDNDNGEEMMSKCSKCGYPVSYFWGKTAFCPGCGRAMTPEAWDELQKRLMG